MEVSNKILSILVIISICFLLLGLFLGSKGKITGAQTTTTDTGQVNLSITQQTNIIFVDGTINFGSGYVNETSSDSKCYLDTEGNSEGPGECVGWSNLSEGLAFRNDGNTNLSVKLNFSKTSAAFINDLLGGAQFKITEDSTAGQLDDTVASCNDGWTNTSYEDLFASTAIYICGNGTEYPLSPENDRDDAVIDFNVTISNTAVIEAKGVIVYLIGTSAE